MAGIAHKGGKVLEIPGVGELVEIDNGVLLEGDPVEDKIGTDEAGTAGDEDGWHGKLVKSVKVKGVKVGGRRCV